MNANELLANSLSPDATTRQSATQQLEDAARENYPAYVVLLSAELANEQRELHIRNAAGIALKNSLSARDSVKLADYATRWLNLDEPTRSKVKQETLTTLSSPTTRAGSIAAQVVASIAAVELPEGGWADLIGTLLTFVNNAENTGLRIATLQAIGFICESIKPEVLSLRANEILTAVIHGARKEEPSAEVQLAAINSLYNSLEFIRDNFEREGERNYIMQVVCEATQNPSVNVQVAAFECLVRIMGLYYDKMGFYMERALFGLTVLGMNHADDTVALQAVEFWSTVCEEEIELAIEAAEALDYNELPEHESKYFAKVALPEIVPVILRLLTRQEEDADEDEWNVSMAAGTCLALLAQAVGDAIVAAVIPFIEANIKSTDWHQREAAVMTFGSILDGPDPQVLNPLVSQALPILIEMMRDQNLHVKDTTAWTLGRICDILVGTIKTDVHLHPLVSALVHGLDDSPRIISNCCWALMNLSDQLSGFYEDEAAPASGPLSPYYQGVIDALIRVTEKSTNESNFRTSAYEALSSFVSHSAVDTLGIVSHVIVTVLSRMESLLTLHNQLLGIDDKNNWNELQGNLCSVAISVVRKLGSEIQPLANRLMTVLLQLIQTAGKHSTVLEDAFLVVGTLASALEQGFHPYLEAFLPFLYPALKAHEDTQLCMVAIGLIGDICRALSDQSAPYCNAFMQVLYENLSSEVLTRNVKIPIISCFGDIALAIGPQFEPYLNATMDVLRQAGETEADPRDYDSIDYVNTLREAIVESYVGMVSGLKSGGKPELLLPHVPAMLDLIRRTLSDEEKTDGAIRFSISLIGDLADAFPQGQIKNILLADWIAGALKTRGRASPETRKTMRWAREMVKRATQ